MTHQDAEAFRPVSLATAKPFRLGELQIDPPTRQLVWGDRVLGRVEVAVELRAALGRVDGEVLASIGPGLAILLGVSHDDDANIADALARRVTELRIFRDEEGRTNRSLIEVRGQALVVSQFTLFADTASPRLPRRSRRSDSTNGSQRRSGNTMCTWRPGGSAPRWRSPS